MKILRYVLLSAALAAPVAGQTMMFDLPTTNPVVQSNNFPFAGPGPMRYQQWYSFSEWAATAVNPVRVTGLEFRAWRNSFGLPGFPNIDVEISMANGNPFSIGSNFDSNLARDRVVVFPRGRINLGVSNPGTYPFSVNFTNEFIWDGGSGVVVDFKIWDNGNNNNPYLYDFEWVIGNPGIARLWSIGNATAPFASTVKTSEGIATRFLYEEAITVPFGTGCAGQGGFTPVAGTSGGLPKPGNVAWAQTLSNAAPQRFALAMVGGSNQMWTATGSALPFDLGPAIGASGCSLLVDPIVSGSTMTIGGGAGGGTASINSPIPPVTSIVGLFYYSQWLVLDPLSPNGVLSASNGLWHIVGL